MIIAYWVQKLLRDIQSIHPEAHIAGGYLRDLDNGREVKDVDIFLPAGNWAEAQLVEKMVTRTHPSVVRYCPANGDGVQYGITDPNVLEAIEYASDDGWPRVNLIKLMTRKACDMQINLARIDFGLCKIGYDGDVYCTPDYIHDREEEQFTLRSCISEDAFLMSMRRYERLREKYDWPLAIPAEFAHYAASVEIDLP